MSTISIEQAQTRLAEMLDQIQPGQEIIITRNEEPIARLVGEKPIVREPRKPGTLRGSVLYMAPDFNAPLDEFKEYMP